MSAKLPVLAEIGVPASSGGCAWGMRRRDFEALGGVREALEERRAVLVTGEVDPVPTLAIALAAVAAAAGRRTALVECDVERPRLAARLGLSPTPGLHEYLRWESRPADVLQSVVAAGPASAADSPPLACVCAGRPSADAGTLLGLGSFHHMARKLRDAYELVVLLGPPLEGADDALGSAAAEADAVIAALAEQPPRRAAKAGAGALARLGPPALGAVVVASSEPRSGAAAEAGLRTEAGEEPGQAQTVAATTEAAAAAATAEAEAAAANEAATRAAE